MCVRVCALCLCAREISYLNQPSSRSWMWEGTRSQTAEGAAAAGAGSRSQLEGPAAGAGSRSLAVVGSLVEVGSRAVGAGNLDMQAAGEGILEQEGTQGLEGSLGQEGSPAAGAGSPVEGGSHQGSRRTELGMHARQWGLGKQAWQEGSSALEGTQGLEGSLGQEGRPVAGEGSLVAVLVGSVVPAFRQQLVPLRNPMGTHAHEAQRWTCIAEGGTTCQQPRHA